MTIDWDREPLHMPRQHRPDEDPPLAEEYPTLTVRSSSPENAEVASRSALDKLLTPVGEHYIRNHYPTPAIDAEEWTISLTGLDSDGENEGESDGPAVDMAELREEYPTESVVHTMECSGNGRAFFEPDADGYEWVEGAVGTAVWTGTPVRALFEAYDIGGDDERWIAVMGGEAPDGEDVFCRSLPMEKVREDCVLAYEMNGRPLPPDHGHSVRLLVPGWFGNNSVKWVDRIHVSESMITGEEWDQYTRFQQQEYRLRFADSEERSSSGSRTESDDDESPPERESIDTFDTYEQMEADEPRRAYFYDQLPKSLLTEPDDGATVAAGKPVEIAGLAWAGDHPIEHVEFSASGGKTWTDAALGEPALGRYAWRRFRGSWTPEAGEHYLLARATDAKGRTQPAAIAEPDPEGTGIEDDTYPWNVEGYGNNAYRPLGVTVTAVRGRP